MLPTVKFSEDQAMVMGPYWDSLIWRYLQWRYGPSWRYYWAEWEINHELIL